MSDERRYNILSDGKFVLESFIKDKGMSRMAITVWNNNPQFLFNLFNSKDKSKNEFFSARFDMLSFDMIMELILKCADADKDVVYTCDNYIMPRDTTEMKFDIKLVVGRDATNGVYIGVVKEGKESRRYYFKPTKFHVFQQNKEEIPKAELSSIHARAYVGVARRHVAFVQQTEYIRGGEQARSAGSSNQSSSAPKKTSEISDEDVSW